MTVEKVKSYDEIFTVTQKTIDENMKPKTSVLPKQQQQSEKNISDDGIFCFFFCFFFVFGDIDIDIKIYIHTNIKSIVNLK